MDRIFVVDNKKLRQLTIREGLRLFGYPESYKINLPVKKAFNLLGESIPVPIVKEISSRLIQLI